MPRPRPLRAQFGNLNHKGGQAKGEPPKNLCGAEGSEVGAPHRFLEGKGASRYCTQTRETHH
eukprot:14539625-Ditylum_brightwellii.AAC.1